MPYWKLSTGKKEVGQTKRLGIEIKGSKAAGVELLRSKDFEEGSLDMVPPLQLRHVRKSGQQLSPVYQH